MVSSLFQVVLGFSGVIGLVLQFVGPLSIMPTIALVGLPLFSAAADFSGNKNERQSSIIGHYEHAQYHTKSFAMRETIWFS